MPSEKGFADNSKKQYDEHEVRRTALFCFLGEMNGTYRC
ncbi:hypothetical protein SDC9_63604 [bioreactor metagenome]|uniref:Uncharacterized protein n=1 Tax=bioreactor metagenome TaxID=1076179 RepID=A0A644XLZ7_9ZZZZ